MFRLKLIMIIGGGFLAFLGVQEFRVSMGTSNDPVPVELASLENGEPTPNNHVVIGQHNAVYGAVVYEYKQRKGSNAAPGPNTKVTHVFYPVISDDHQFFQDLNRLAEEHGNLNNVPEAQWPGIDDFTVLVKSKAFKTIGQIPNGLSSEEKVQGLVINLIGGLDKDEKRLLHSSFPKTDLDNVIIVEEGRHPASLVKSLGFTVGGLILSLLGIGSFFTGRD